MSSLNHLARRARRIVAPAIRRIRPHRTSPEPERHDRILDEYVREAPSAQLAIDLFDDEWASWIPDGPHGHVDAGITPLFDDPRIRWAEEQFGGFAGMRALELGPLEGGHSFMLDRAGVVSVDAIEANTRAYLKCLVVKELLGMERVRFHLGDFMAYLGDPDDLTREWIGDGNRFDVAVASGVLYHMQDPVGLLAGLAAVSDRLFVWTQYFDAERIAALGPNDRKFDPIESRVHDGFEYESAVQHYGVTLATEGFCGGPEHQSRWLTRESLLGALRHVGYDDVHVSFDEPEHRNGPAIAICASRTPGR